VTQTRADGAVSTRTVTWDGRGGATLAETRPDGTVIAGSFDESTGGYTQTLSFPDGHDPVSIARHGTATEGAVEAWETVTWRDGRTDETYFSSNETETGVSFSGHRIEGELREDFTLLVEADGGSSGTWERNDGAVGDYELELLEGGGQHLLFSASEPNEPGSPSVAGDIDFAPDGSGVGLLTLTQYGGTLTFTIIIGADGTGTLVDPAGNSVQL